MFAILLLPVFGDFLDIIGIIACLVMFRWIGIISLLELVPGADVLPIFMITWLIWYFLKKAKKVEQERLHKTRVHSLGIVLGNFFHFAFFKCEDSDF